MSERVKLSVIIVSYNTRQLTVECIRSVYRESETAFELLVVDNASTDGSADAIRAEFPPERYPNLRLMALSENLGFAAANNLAADQARGDYLLLLNPDTVVLDRALEKLAAFADAHPEYGIYGGGTLFADGSRNPTAGWMKPSLWGMFCTAVGLGRLFRGSRFFNPESLAGWSWDAPRPVDIVTGCLLLMRREDWQRLGGFDEQYFMYGEDADLCLRAAKAGLQPVLVPEARIIHYGGASEPVRADKTVRLLRAKVQLLRAHYHPVHAAAMVGMLRLWCLMRIAMFGLAQPLTAAAGERRREWLDVWRRRTDWQLRAVAA
ncbi:MAG: glycosyltransferase family 2 protein [Spirochaetaceae bacterium]|nr:MAG: glycosyltransferase family 2 protein [Spirochaetaceae bacterium]